MAEAATTTTNPPIPRVAVARPLYHQVREMMLERISRGDWAVGDALPNEFQLSSEFGVSIGTIRRAIEGLEDAGIVVRKQGRGTFLAGSRRQAISEKFCALRLPGGDRPELTYRLETKQRRAATAAEAARLQCRVGNDLFEIEQLVLVKSAIAGIERSMVEATRFPNLDRQLLYGQDLYPVYSDYGMLVTRALDRASLGAAEAWISRRLEVAPGSPVLGVERLSFAIDDRPVELKSAWYCPAHVVYASEILR